MHALSLAAAPFPDPTELPAQPQLPDLLTMRDGTRVTTKEQWLTQRAPELRALVQHYEYGVMPAKPAGFDAKVIRTDANALGGKATLKEIEIRTTQPDATVDLLVVVPNKKSGPAPCFLGMNFYGNYALLPDPQIRAPRGWVNSSRFGGPNDKADDIARGKERETWSIEQSIDRGYAVASFFSGDVIPDKAELALERLKSFIPAGKDAADADLPATIACWAWGFSRMIDYLATDADIDAKRIAVVGHSRNGKTALLAGAMDERIALVIPSQAGCGGSAPARMDPELAKPQANGRPTAETVAAITKAFPHWFDAHFKKFGDAVEKLPFDQHALIALCAPRPVLLSNADEDRWANPSGQFQLLQAASPVYELVAGDGLTAKEQPQNGQLVASRLGYFIRPGKHSMTQVDWAAWLDYADKWLK